MTLRKKTSPKKKINCSLAFSTFTTKLISIISYKSSSLSLNSCLDRCFHKLHDLGTPSNVVTKSRRLAEISRPNREKVAYSSAHSASWVGIGLSQPKSFFTIHRRKFVQLIKHKYFWTKHKKKEKWIQFLFNHKILILVRKIKIL